MKNIILWLTFLLGGGQIAAQTWTWEQAPKAGENIMVTVTDVPESEGIYMTYYGFEGTMLVAGDVGMVPSNTPGTITAPIVIHDHMNWVRVVLKDEHGEVISGDEQFVINANALPKAGLVEQALASVRYGRYMDIKTEPNISLVALREAVATHPAWLEEKDVLISYYSVAKQTNSSEDLAVVKAFVEGLAQKSTSVSEAILVQGVRVAKDMGDTTLQETLRKKVDKKYPKSVLAQDDLYLTFSKAATIEEKMKIREQFRSMFPVTKENTGMHDQMTSAVAQHYVSKEDWDRVKKYVDQINDPIARQRACNSYAWALSGERIEADAPHLEIAETLSAQSLQILRGDIKAPVGLTKKEWQQNIDYSFAQNADTYALIVFKQGKYNEALDHQLLAVRQNKYQDTEMNERYAAYLEKAGQTKPLEQFMDEMYVTGKASPKMKEQHRAYWTGKASSQQLYEQYAGRLEADAKAYREEKILQKWQDDPAIMFSLRDLDGHEVSLSDYMGKTVVLDFWATWCGPCKASFPGMKNAVEHYASDNSVAFLFIDTWERGDGIQDKVAKFISDNNYPFHVLMDLDNKIVADYGVEGIPTKFIIGPDQKIRFTSVGYGGNNDELVEEIKTMIEMARGKVRT